MADEYCTDHPATETDGTARVVQLDEVVLVGRAGIAAATIHLADHDPAGRERAGVGGGCYVSLDRRLQWRWGDDAVGRTGNEGDPECCDAQHSIRGEAHGSWERADGPVAAACAGHWFMGRRKKLGRRGHRYQRLA
jgi:hypothetical protein